MDFQERVLYVARNYVEYGRYGGDEERAVKTVHKHHPDVPMSVCRDELRGFVDAYGDAVRLVDDNSEYYWSVKDRVPAGR